MQFAQDKNVAPVVALVILVNAKNVYKQLMISDAATYTKHIEPKYEIIDNI